VDVEESNAVDHLDEARKFVSYRPDAHVLAEAMSLGADWFITHDKEHFLRARPRKPLPFEIGTPGDLLQMIKTQLSGG
jgi:predicted nucleic acid-binding protein